MPEVKPQNVLDFDFDIPLTFACLREVPPCGTKAGILALGLVACNPNILILRLEEY
ncbi:MAG: hypothetical protein ACLQGU_08525 [bacterium]